MESLRPAARDPRLTRTGQGSAGSERRRAHPQWLAGTRRQAARVRLRFGGSVAMVD
jgi:hypothetical protein